MDGARCLLCHGPVARPGELCPFCRDDLPAPAAACPRCGVAMTAAAPCAQCAAAPPSFDVLLAGFPYIFPVDHMLQEWKYRGRLYWLPVLCEGLRQRIVQTASLLPQALVPVPLHPLRQWQRGFNQADLLANRLGTMLDLPVWRGVRRRRFTSSQTGQSPLGRRRNLRGAFDLSVALPFRHLALVDDVCTTGATAGEIAALLKAGGAAQVEVWCVAHAGAQHKRR